MVDATQNLTVIQKSYFVIIDTLICFIFLFEFFYKLNKSDSKAQYIRGHWIDLIASIPFIEFLRVGRLLRLIRLFRILRIGLLFGKQASRLMQVFQKGTFNYIAFVMLNILYWWFNPYVLY